ncbi:hypothetical protein BDR26DRAFT_895815 [Obelidium mucronatum]|nr:hypothetical protein BDR26DRAFT_895815 [Obelidium mucronatum]
MRTQAVDRAKSPSGSSGNSSRSGSSFNGFNLNMDATSAHTTSGRKIEEEPGLESQILSEPGSTPTVAETDLAKLSVSFNSGSSNSGGAFSYRDLDPEEAARFLYEDKVPEVPREKMVETLSKLDDFHKAVLTIFMSLLPMPVDLISSLRGLCLRAPLKGEAQQIDRVISAFAEHWWIVNGSNPSVIFRSQDIVYGMVFSLVLLNTDMYSANVKTKMTVKAFISNTMHFVNSMAAEDHEGDAVIAPMTPAEEEEWRKDLEYLLRDMYAAVRAAPIIVQDKSTSPTTPNRSRANTLASTSSPFTMGSSIFRKQSLTFTNTNKRKSLNLETVEAQSSPPPLPTTRDFDFLPPQSITTIKPRSRFLSEFSLVEEPTTQEQAAPTTTTTTTTAGNALAEGVSLEGLLIRKHVQNAQGVKATFRAWVPLWCVICISRAKGVELCMFEVEGENAKDDIFATEDDWDVNGKANGGGGGGGGIQVPTNRAPEVVTVLHSHSKALPSPGYNQTRQHVFYLCLSDGSILLFQTRTSFELRQWCDTLNYWAARWSMGPLRGAIGSAEYGWTEFEWDALRKEMGGSNGGASEGSEGGRNSEEQPRSSSGVFSKRVDDWEVPRTSTMVVSHFDALKQIGTELEAHLSYKAPMERKVWFCMNC